MFLPHLRLHYTKALEGATLPQPVSPSQVPEAMWQEVLPKVLKPDLNSILGSPEHLEIFLLAQQKVPRQLEKLMGPVNLLSDENIPRYEGSWWVPGAKGLPFMDLQYGLGCPCFPCLLGGCHLSPLCPPQTGDCAEDGRQLCEEGAQTARCGSGPAPPGSSGKQVPVVLE